MELKEATKVKGIVNRHTHTSIDHAPQRKEQGAHIQQAMGQCTQRDQRRSRNRTLCAYTTAMHGELQYRRTQDQGGTP
jgi:hypothetical protein